MLYKKTLRIIENEMGELKHRVQQLGKNVASGGGLATANADQVRACLSACLRVCVCACVPVCLCACMSVRVCLDGCVAVCLPAFGRAQFGEPFVLRYGKKPLHSVDAQPFAFCRGLLVLVGLVCGAFF